MKDSISRRSTRRSTTTFFHRVGLAWLWVLLAFASATADENGLPEEVGNLDTGQGGGPFAVLFVNGTTGNSRHVILVQQNSPLTITTLAPPAGPMNASYALYARIGEPTAADVRALPLGTGSLVMPNPVTDVNPNTFVIANSLGFPSQLGIPLLPVGPGPGTIVNRPNGLPQPITLTLQSIVRDLNAPNGRAGVSNAIILKVLPPSGDVVAFIRPDPGLGNSGVVVVRDVVTGVETIVEAAPDVNESAVQIDGQGTIAVFAADLDGPFDIFTKNLSTGALTQVTTSNMNSTFPQISIDGTIVAYESGTLLSRHIRLVNLRTMADRAIISDAQFLYFDPSLSPDGNWVACTSSEAPDSNVYLYDCRNDVVTNITPNESSLDDTPSISANGIRTAFRSFRTGDSEIFVFRRTSGMLTNISQHPAADSDPVISASGNLVAFRSNRDGNREIYVYDFSTGQVSNISNDPGSDARPVFSFDEKRLFFDSNRTGNGDIYRYEFSTGMVTRISNNVAPESSVNSN